MGFPAPHGTGSRDSVTALVPKLGPLNLLPRPGSPTLPRTKNGSLPHVAAREGLPEVTGEVRGRASFRSGPFGSSPWTRLSFSPLLGASFGPPANSWDASTSNPASGSGPGSNGPTSPRGGRSAGWGRGRERARRPWGWDRGPPAPRGSGQRHGRHGGVPAAPRPPPSLPQRQRGFGTSGPQSRGARPCCVLRPGARHPQSPSAKGSASARPPPAGSPAAPGPPGRNRGAVTATAASEPPPEPRSPHPLPGLPRAACAPAELRPPGQGSPQTSRGAPHVAVPGDPHPGPGHRTGRGRASPACPPPTSRVRLQPPSARSTRPRPRPRGGRGPSASAGQARGVGGRVRPGARAGPQRPAPAASPRPAVLRPAQRAL
ncbi:basic salivary proline-rich protein 3-like [Sciurus carolinensis]|uniref:basic salivary proline-rich protein 3-like n=1 Tax=Sciurus carolinensis TaxID=30640 RepID=UPI001FB43620|nr:basic salivary proline-rich protein 3-like [Sciurus carolinensis]XP_047390500.1 basic salivary proline-rich protein 3-like [Sciurus carolinensis]